MIVYQADLNSKAVNLYIDAQEILKYLYNPIAKICMESRTNAESEQLV